MDAVRDRGWPTWAWVLLILQVATLVIALVPWLAMSWGMMGMSMTPMMDPQQMQEMMPGQ